MSLVHWTAAETDRAQALKAKGFTMALIADCLTEEFGHKRAKKAVANRLQRNAKGLCEKRPPELRSQNHAAAQRMVQERKVAERQASTTQRTCLCCRSKFPSEWVGNRICDPCKQTVAW